MTFAREGFRGRIYSEYRRILTLPAHERYKTDELVKQRMRNMGLDITTMYPPAGTVTADDVTYYADSTLITADGAIA